MTQTELLALAADLDAEDYSVHNSASQRAAALIRKLAALEPVAWSFESRFVDTAWTQTVSDVRVTEGHYCRNVRALYNLTGIIDHE